MKIEKFTSWSEERLRNYPVNELYQRNTDTFHGLAPSNESIKVSWVFFCNGIWNSSICLFDMVDWWSKSAQRKCMQGTKKSCSIKLNEKESSQTQRLWMRLPMRYWCFWPFWWKPQEVLANRPVCEQSAMYSNFVLACLLCFINHEFHSSTPPWDVLC